MGEPLGFPMVTGGPLAYLGVVVMLLPGVGSVAAAVAAQAICTGVGLIAGYAMLCRLGARRAAALVGSTLHEVPPSVLGMEGFGGTFTGFALLPADVVADLLLTDKAEQQTTPRFMLWASGYVGVRMVAVFMDGYAFVASALVSGAIWVAWA